MIKRKKNQFCTYLYRIRSGMIIIGFLVEQFNLKFLPYVTYLLITIIRLEEEIVSFSFSGEENKVDHRTIRHVLVIDCHLIDLSGYVFSAQMNIFVGDFNSFSSPLSLFRSFYSNETSVAKLGSMSSFDCSYANE